MRRRTKLRVVRFQSPDSWVSIPLGHRIRLWLGLPFIMLGLALTGRYWSKEIAESIHREILP